VPVGAIAKGTTAAGMHTACYQWDFKIVAMG